jgi:hypothetical protein
MYEKCDFHKKRGYMTKNMFFQNAIFEIGVEKTLHGARKHYQLL